ncbi:MAG: hypothetical protein DCC71_02940 [Proteobacteria bacterium]|nr:MAG: hypothetical protein DCC71_02940 [Pseudomonadota bacterium]
MPYPSAALMGRGFQLFMGDGGSPEGFDLIAEVRDFTDLDPRTREFEDVTNQETPSGGDEVKPAILRGGESTFECNFLPTHATHDESTGLRADLVSGARRNFRAVIPGVPKRFAFAAYVVRFPVAVPVNGVIRGSVTLRMDGAPSWEAHP